MKSSLLPWLPSLSVSLGAATLLAACASDPVYVACPEITAPEEGVEAFMQMDDTNEVVNARLNGVTARCEAVEGGIEMAVSIGLKIKRLPAETLPAGVAQINIAGMTVEEDGAVGRARVEEGKMSVRREVDRGALEATQPCLWWQRRSRSRQHDAR